MGGATAFRSAKPHQILCDMHSQPISVYIQFGAHMRFLQDARGGSHPNRQYREVASINAVLKAMEDFGLPVSRRAAWRLAELGEKLASKGDAHVLTEDEATAVNEAVGTLRKTLHA